MTEYSRISSPFGGPGRYTNSGMVSALETYCAIKGIELKDLYCLQGSFNVGVAASAGTHDKADCLDFRWPLDAALLKRIGIFAWHRTPAQGFTEHCHLGRMYSTAMAWLATEQDETYRSRKANGLGNLTHTDTSWCPTHRGVKHLSGPTSAKYVTTKATNGYTEGGFTGSTAPKSVVKTTREKGYILSNIAGAVRVNGHDYWVTTSGTFYNKANFIPYVAPKPPVVAAPKPAPKPAVETVAADYISGNLAGYDHVHGEATRKHRAAHEIPDYLAPKKPMWFHFQECAVDMYPYLDKRLPDYKRIAEGGKGRESYYRKDAGITIIEAKLLNVSHMLAKDTKEFLVIAWERQGAKGVYVNFHNENEGSAVQLLQLWDVMKAGVAMADKHGILHLNIVYTGDSNTKKAAAFAKLRGWTEAIYSAKKKVDLQWVSTNGWKFKLVKGDRIDVDISHKDNPLDSAEQLYGVIADHYAHRVHHHLVKA